ncbi:8-oxo-dGTP pyrophosphatase MutT (NUDIX family) [Dyadobacter jejuensis]|uniref:8-oxo-dGTP pyrophosphatase MutT (NUDIX family) n=1 Tax=Dyadobacter jejuensis TaxID=1082580 RepID=A0A316ACU1_9BACT|nr:CoA pyrophosphatase [Dyadobacter jejuensis]PWJ55606.1 8-oxo-dGTP pyrophosphatase MutT (NUDIX family) [Dyadobacter jejuensis]
MANTTFELFTTQFSERLKSPLPGEMAHRSMQANTRNRMHFKPNDRTRNSAVLIVFYPHEGDIYFPVILRPSYDGVHSGQVAFPGGSKEPTDPDLVHTALREAQEEIGLPLEDVQILGRLTEVFIPPSNFLVLPVVAYVSYRPRFLPDPREVADIYEIKFSEISQQSIIGSSKMMVRGEAVTAPHYALHGQKIWGATAMMISELLSVYQTP